MRMFEPVLALVFGELGRYTLVSATPTPNTCFCAGPAQVGVPAGYAVAAHTVAVQLEIRDAGRPLCLPVITPVQHRLENLDLPASTRWVQVFTMVDGKVAGHDAVPVPESPRCVAAPAPRRTSLVLT